ncbi:MAG: ABC transporter permease [Firmicutes bacterium]|nr:ABC transporter permease [Bacillota bacterium]MCL5040062.1 ABC transporter permease [Bacillota bacterium]
MSEPLPATGGAITRAPSRIWRRLSRHQAGLVGFVIVLVILLASLLAGILTPYPPDVGDMVQNLLPPGSPGHLLGTDQLGRDVLARILYGSRISLAIGVYTVVVAGALGTVVGLLSGFWGGWLDTAAMRLVDVQLSFPFILLALVISAILGGGFRNLIITLVISTWVMYARLVRGEVLAVKEKEYVEAARAGGSTDWHIIFRHVLPNVSTPIIIVSSLQIAQLIVAEAAISFLGFGVQPPDVSWGLMLADGRDYMMNAWWLATFPGIALAIAALGINLVGDWLRDIWDPRLKV